MLEAYIIDCGTTILRTRSEKYMMNRDETSEQFLYVMD